MKSAFKSVVKFLGIGVMLILAPGTADSPLQRRKNTVRERLGSRSILVLQNWRGKMCDAKGSKNSLKSGNRIS